MLLGFDSFAESPLDGAPFRARTSLTQVSAVSSNFQLSALRKNAVWQRSLTIGTSDYSSRVLQWPTIDKVWNNINPSTVLIDLANDDRALNFILSDTTNLQAQCTLSAGFVYPQLLQYSENWLAAEWHAVRCTVASVSGGFLVTRTDTTSAGVLSTSPPEFSTALAGRTFSMRATLWTDSSQVNSIFVGLGICDATGAHLAVNTVTPTQTPTNYSVSYTFSSDTTSNFITVRINPLGTCSGAYFYGNYAMLENGASPPAQYMPSSGIVQAAELLTLFTGTIDAAQYSAGKLSLTIADKFMQLAKRTIGNSASAQAYTGSQYMVHDLAWWLCTSHGGLSSVRSTSNTDIDYTSFSSWSSLFSADNTRLQGNFTGQRITEALQKISNLTQSAIFIKGGLLTFSRFLLSAQPTYQFTDADVLDTITTLDQRNTINQEAVSAAYNVSSSTFGVVATWNNTSSIASYGLYSDVMQETVVWLVDSISATNLAQRQIQTFGVPLAELDVTAPFVALNASVGDCIGYSDTHLQIVAQAYRIMGESINMEQGTKAYKINQTQLSAVFHLDVSAMDSSDVLP